VLFIPKQLGLGLVVRPMKSFAFMQGFFDFVRYYWYRITFVLTKASLAATWWFQKLSKRY
jgi:hypothetical protein